MTGLISWIIDGFWKNLALGKTLEEAQKRVCIIIITSTILIFPFPLRSNNISKRLTLCSIWSALNRKFSLFKLFYPKSASKIRTAIISKMLTTDCSWVFLTFKSLYSLNPKSFGSSLIYWFANSKNCFFFSKNENCNY